MQRTLALQSIEKVGEEITVAGWVNSTRDHGGLIFIDLRDHTGIVQLAIHPDDAGVFSLAETVRDEFVISATGTVTKRTPETVNENIPTGTVEILVSHFSILNSSKPLPFPIQHQGEVNEDLRLQYRFLDMRREKIQNLMVRKDKFITRVRDYMHHRGFTEVTTPILTSSSPEGARDYLVPSRIHPGKFYALPQAPQQFKQLLMVGGLPKYFQIAPCFRDEDPRADRHPGEFYQLDLEIAFATDHEEVFAEVEPLLIDITENFAHKQVLLDETTQKIPRIPYKVAMEKYGTDKPDLRFGMELTELTELLRNTDFSVFANAIQRGGCVKAINLTGGAKLTRSQIDQLTEMVKKEGAGGLAYIICESEAAEGTVKAENFGETMYLKSPILKFLSPEEITGIVQTMHASVGDIIFFGADERNLVNKVLGKLRSELANDFGLKDPSVIAWAFIVDFPMYEWNEQEKKVDFSHNPFSMPQGGLEALKTQDPLTILAHQYDVVANGYELCSGGIRNYKPEAMYKAFEIAGISKETVDEKFGGMIRAFEYGAPPHGGCAFGIDRWFMVLEDEPNIREVIAFPKNGSAEDVLMGAPGTVDEKQLKELHIKLDIPAKKEK